MTFCIIFSVSFILLLAYIVSKRKLHLFEILFIWMVVIIIHNNFLTITAINLRMFDFAETPNNYWSLVLMRMLLIPLLIIWYLDHTLSPKWYTKWVWLPIGILLLVGIENMGQVLNVYKATRWKFWWSFIEWFVILVLVIYPCSWFRNLLKSELK